MAYDKVYELVHHSVLRLFGECRSPDPSGGVGDQGFAGTYP
jgi:hypothetical protein